MPRRKSSHAEGAHDNEERWLLTYSDMITLLFVLFVVMYAISNTDVRKFVALAESMKAAFNTDVMQGSTPITVMSGQESAPGDQGFDGASGVVATDMRTVEAALKDYAIENGFGSGVEVDRVPAGIVIRLSDALLFSPGRAHLDDAASAFVAKVAQVIAPLPNQVRVEGNTDDQAPTGGLYADNWQLSTARALEVVRALQGLGIPPNRLSAAGYAEFNPLVPDTDDASRGRNRRVDIVVLYPQSSTVSSPQPSLLASPDVTR